jgi:YVTN family beta-propeller protein
LVRVLGEAASVDLSADVEEGPDGLRVRVQGAGCAMLLEEEGEVFQALEHVLQRAYRARLASGAGSIWVTSSPANSVYRIDAVSHQLRQTIHVGNGPNGIAYGDGKVWVANSLDGTVSRIDPDANDVAGEPIRVGNSPTAVAFGFGSVWVTNVDDASSRESSRRAARQADRHRAAGRGIAVGAGSSGSATAPRTASSASTPSERGGTDDRRR